MKIVFWKYQGNGNDFIILDEWKKQYNLNIEKIAMLCNRHYGIGADGLIRLTSSKKFDFEMKYYNADGKQATMCGNGGRCIAAFAYIQKYVSKNMTFATSDGQHNASILKEISPNNEYYISLKMNDVNHVDIFPEYYFLDTGSPHYVEFVDNIFSLDVISKGKKIRNNKLFAPEGTNVDFVEITKSRLFVRTYERGVENETLSCGTGVTASAIAAYLKTGKKDLIINTYGGDFKVGFKETKGIFSDISLEGPAKMVFNGTIYQ